MPFWRWFLRLARYSLVAQPRAAPPFSPALPTACGPRRRSPTWPRPFRKLILPRRIQHLKLRDQSFRPNGLVVDAIFPGRGWVSAREWVARVNLTGNLEVKTDT